VLCGVLRGCLLEPFLVQDHTVADVVTSERGSVFGFLLVSGFAGEGADGSVGQFGERKGWLGAVEALDQVCVSVGVVAGLLVGVSDEVLVDGFSGGLVGGLLGDADVHGVRHDASLSMRVYTIARISREWQHHTARTATSTPHRARARVGSDR